MNQNVWLELFSVFEHFLLTKAFRNRPFQQLAFIHMRVVCDSSFDLVTLLTKVPPAAPSCLIKLCSTKFYCGGILSFVSNHMHNNALSLYSV